MKNQIRLGVIGTVLLVVVNAALHGIVVQSTVYRGGFTSSINQQSLPVHQTSINENTLWSIEYITYGFALSFTFNHQRIPFISLYDGDQLAYATFVGTSWVIQPVDQRFGHVGQYNSISIDTEDNLHISYIDDHTINPVLRYAFYNWSIGQWFCETVDEVGVPRATSIAVDADNHPVIAYLDGTSQNLKWAYHTGNGWQINTVDNAGDVGWAATVRLDHRNYTHISYYDATNRALKYALWNGTSWRIEVLDACEPGAWDRGIALEVDSECRPHIAYTSIEKKPKYTVFNETEWITEEFDVDHHTDLVALDLDSYDYPHIAVLQFDVDRGRAELIYLASKNGSWVSEQIAEDGGYAGLDLAINPLSNQPSIVYEAIHENKAGHLLYVTHDDLPRKITYPIQVEGTSFVCSITTTAIISNVSFDESTTTLLFEFSKFAATGYPTSITFPMQLLGEPYLVAADDAPIIPIASLNDTHATLTMTLLPDTSKVTIRGTTVASNFPITAIAITLIVVLIVTVILERRARKGPISASLLA